MTNFEISTGTFREDLIDFNILKFITARREAKLDVDYFFIESRFTAKNISDTVKKVLDKTKLKLPYSIHGKLNAEMFEDDVIISLSPNFDLKTLEIAGYGDPAKIDSYGKIFRKAFPSKERDIKMSWYYGNGRGFESVDLDVDAVVVKDAYYPYIRGGVDKYLEEYHNSKSSILLLAGEPGTGKTSLINYYLNSYGLNSIVTYDENVMQRDDFYINFLTSNKKHVLIVEDADLLLEARSNGENKLMSKFLNVSDGLVKGLNKKIIFSTNITQLERIDSAVIRPGRCFDVIEFRKLDREEANAVCDLEGLPKFDDAGEYSLGDIFNRNPRSMKVRKTGFI